MEKAEKKIKLTFQTLGFERIYMKARKIEKRKQKQKQIEQRENDNKMPDLSSNMSINDINTPI